MAAIPQALSGREHEIGRLGDSARPKIAPEALPGRGLMDKTEKERGKGRDDLPARAMRNLLMAGCVFGHASTASPLREPSRNIQLAHACGSGFGKPPKARNMSRSTAALLKRGAEAEGMFESLSQSLRSSLGGFGRDLAMGGKRPPSAAGHASKRKPPDGRSGAGAKKGNYILDL